MNRPLALLLLCLLLLLPAAALATEDQSVFESPTRDPHAEYDKTKPEELQPEHIVGHSFILMERSSGNVLYERNADDIMFPASTTKIMTALLALKYGELTDTLTIPEAALNFPEDASMVPFSAYEEVTLEAALYGLLLRSGNEAAYAIAEYISGDVGSFVAQMNQEAQDMGCTSTHFTNPHGYHDEAHVTTARDLALIMDVALSHPTFRKMVGTAVYTLPSTDMNPARRIVNSNLHIVPLSELPSNDYYYTPSIGGKTGFHSMAGYVLVEAAASDGVELIAVTMYSGRYSRWPDTQWLFEYGFTQYLSVTPDEIYEENPIILQINGFAKDDNDLGRLELSLRPLDAGADTRITKLKAEIDSIVENFYSLYTNIRYSRELRAPIQSGDVLGILTFYPDSREPVEYELIATRSIAVRDDAPPTLEEIEAMAENDDSFFPPFGLDWILPPVLGLAAIALGVRALLRLAFRNRRSKKRIPKPTKRRIS